MLVGIPTGSHPSAQGWSEPDWRGATQGHPNKIVSKPNGVALPFTHSAFNLLPRRLKAPEDWLTPRRFAHSGAVGFRASVLDCGGPPPLFITSAQVMPPFPAFFAMFVQQPNAKCSAGKIIIRYPERFAQEALGHDSKAVHQACARKAKVELPSLGEQERQRARFTGSRSKRPRWLSLRKRTSNLDERFAGRPRFGSGPRDSRTV